MDRTQSRVAVLLTLICILAAALACGDDSDDGEASGAQTPSAAGAYDPELVAEGEAAYQQTCAMCHGDDLNGTDDGPPFLDPVYAPDHHPDEAFFAAAANGVQPHHWDFGPMPPQPDVTPDEVQAIVAYVRTQQIEAGIIEDPSQP
jgi:mono/diheme cytochrome c family protein